MLWASQNAGAVVRAAMAVTKFGPGGDTPGDVDNDIAQTLLSQRHMMFKDSEVEMQDGVAALTTAVGNAVDHGRPLDCTKMLRDIVFRTHLDTFRRALLGDPPAHMKPMTVRLQPGARVVREKPRVSPIVRIPGDENCWGDLLLLREMRTAGSDKFPTKGVLGGLQAAAAEGGPTLDMAFRAASQDPEGLYRVEHHDHRVILVPRGTDSMKKRLMVYSHLEGGEHRWVDTTMAQLERHCAWAHGKTLPQFTVSDNVLVA